MMSRLWWTRLVNSARFLDEAQDALMEGQSILLSFESEVPWKETMLETLEQKLLDMTDSRTFDIIDAGEADTVSSGKDKFQAGRCLMERYCSREEQKKYWPTTHGRPECFLAQSSDTTLNSRFVCVTGINQKNLAMWTESVSEYISACEDGKEHGIFILVAECPAVTTPKPLLLKQYADYVSDYDCMMLCLTVISEIKCGKAEKMYLCEAASNIAHGNVELAGLLASEGLKLIQQPEPVVSRVYEENGIDTSGLHDQVRMAIWEAQIKLVFPRLENFRAQIIRKYESRLQGYLPIRSSNNDSVDKAIDLEIGQLYYLCKNNAAARITSLEEFEKIRKMRDARNMLAHWDTLSYEKLKDLGVL